MGYGVIGNTSDSGSFVLGSSPGTPALTARLVWLFCFNRAVRKLGREEAEQYFQLISADRAVILQDLRNRLVKLAEAEPELIISYQLPTVIVGGKPFLSFAAWKDFYSIYFLSGRVGSQIKAELTQGKLDNSTLRFSWNERVNDKTLKLIIKAKLADLLASAD